MHLESVVACIAQLLVTLCFLGLLPPSGWDAIASKGGLRKQTLEIGWLHASMIVNVVMRNVDKSNKIWIMLIVYKMSLQILVLFDTVPLADSTNK